jgi:hypothetical protein
MIVPSPHDGGELGPDLPMASFVSSERWHPERLGGLALYCSDGRWGEAFDEFCHRHLLMPRYDRWAVPGGPAWLAPREEATELSRATREQLDFLVRAHDLKRIVLITHYACAYYGKRLNQDARGCLPAQFEDLRGAAELLRQTYPDLRVDGYLAMRRGHALSFHAFEV